MYIDHNFRLAYFERKHKFYSQLQLISEVKAHYIGQFVKQLYVLVLGLDVLGNPFGLVTGLKQGVEDFFYEPFQVMKNKKLNLLSLHLMAFRDAAATSDVILRDFCFLYYSRVPFKVRANLLKE